MSYVRMWQLIVQKLSYNLYQKINAAKIKPKKQLVCFSKPLKLEVIGGNILLVKSTKVKHFFFYVLLCSPVVRCFYYDLR